MRHCAILKVAARAAVFCFVLASATAALATDGAWIGASGGNWSDVVNWQGSAYATGIGSSAYFTNGAGGTIVQDLGSLTLGNLYFANASMLLTNNAITLNGGGTSVIRVDGNANTAIVSVALSPAAGTVLVKEGTGMFFLNKNLGGLSGITLNGGTMLIGPGVGGDGLGVGYGPITVNSGATLKYGAVNQINNDAVIDIKAGGVFDVSGMGDNIGVIMGAGVVTNHSANLQFWMHGTTRTFSGRCYGGGTFSFLQPGTFVGRFRV